MLKKISPLVLVMAFSLTACVTLKDTTPSERALGLSHQYQILEDTYKAQYLIATEYERNWLKTNIAPPLDKARQLVNLYSFSVLKGTGDEEYRIKAMSMMRKITMQLFVTEEDEVNNKVEDEINDKVEDEVENKVDDLEKEVNNES